MTDKMTIEETINGLQDMIQSKKYIEHNFDGVVDEDVCERAIELLKEQRARELTIEEWREWKTNQRRDPICMLWENDTSPMWVLSPNDIHEPALLIGKLKLFNGKPTHEQCKAIKWDV